ncbi:hypothetical protein BD289DRAFT_372283 [Coniella lustricola]|uniref:Hemerythrin-like domain-containing protein n=1 Tax=Coniella lustricola TaxID=2025994 RepID=A0A2T3A2L8_9PEZI|nr:hypothetical protein BD289DRAFT_372283 [Coniella lustricola]
MDTTAAARRDSSATTTTTTSNGIGVRFVSHEVKRDHRDLEILYKAILHSIEEGDAQAAAQLQSRFAWDLARHLAALQLFIFPGTEKRANAGSEIARRRRGDLSKIRDELLTFVHLRPLSEEFSISIGELGETLREHIKDIETQDLVAIEKNLDSDESERMAWDWVRTCSFVPGLPRRRSRACTEGEMDGKGSAEEDVGVNNPRGAPFGTVDEMLKAPIEELQKALAELP